MDAPGIREELYQHARRQGGDWLLHERHVRHGYSFPVWLTYQRAGADRNWERIFAMFHRQIPASA